MAEFNSLVSPFSDIEDTAKLLRAVLSSKSIKLSYNPGAPSGVSGDSNGHSINTHCAPDLREEGGTTEPWTNFMKRLIPDEGDRHQTLRWCATLIAKPEVKMSYGLLMISEVQGIGKGTLGEKILLPLVGIENVSSPSESDVVDSQFNSWLAHKRLAIIHEIYAGASTKAYNKLKSVITDRYILVNKKNMPTYEIENWLHVFACSNSARALKLNFEDRRWFVPKLTEEKSDLKYWTGLNAWLTEQGGLGIIKRWAREYLASNNDFSVRSGETAPDSAAKRAMIEENMSPGEEVATSLLDQIRMENVSGGKFFISDQSVVEHVKDELYGGRQDPMLVKPETVRRWAKSRGWYVREEKTRKWTPSAKNGRLMFTDPAAVKIELDELELHGFSSAASMTGDDTTRTITKIIAGICGQTPKAFKLEDGGGTQKWFPKSTIAAAPTDLGGGKFEFWVKGSWLKREGLDLSHWVPYEGPTDEKDRSM